MSDIRQKSSKHTIADLGSPEATCSEREGKRQRQDKEDAASGTETAAGTNAVAASAPSGRPSVGARHSHSSDDIAAKCRTSTLFVGGLHPRVADVHLQKLFQPYGTITRIFQVKHKEGSLAGQPKGYAFVEFSTVDSARMAIRRIDGIMLLGRTLHVRPAHDKTGGTTADAGDGTGAAPTPNDARTLRKEKSEVESKIEAVKRAIEEKRRRGGLSRR